MTLQRVRTALFRARTYYRLHGAGATAKKIATKLLDPVSRGIGLNSSLPARAFFAPGEVSVTFRSGDVLPLRPLLAGSIYIQEIEVNLTAIKELEILLGTNNRHNTSRNEVLIYSSGGRLLYREEFESRAVRHHHFHRVVPPEPIDIGGGGRFYLALRSADGTRRNCITAFMTRRVSGPVLLIPADRAKPSGVQDLPALAHARRIAGSLIYRIRGNCGVSRLLYRQPAPPAAWRDRCAAEVPRVTVYRPAAGVWSKDLPKALSTASGGASFDTVRSLDAARQRLEGGLVDVLVLMDATYDENTRALLRLACAAYVPTAYYLAKPRDLAETPAGIPGRGKSRSSDSDADAEFSKRQTMRACNYVLCEGAEAFAQARSERTTGFPLEDFQVGDATTPRPQSWHALLDAYRRLHRPLVSIVGILYRKEREIRHVLESYYRQTYDGEIEVILVDDCTPDESVAAVQEFVAGRGRQTEGGGDIKVRIVQNPNNVGNCTSRNRGIREARGDIIVIIDADCVVNRDFILRHVEAHAFGDCEVVIGPMNIETRGEDPRRVLESYERCPDRAVSEAALQDPLNRSSFLNCITRNLSIKASAVTGELFDPLFTYSAEPDSGFGWEDVEMGYRQYKSGARIKFCEEAFSLHISDDSATSDLRRPARLMRNFRRLFEKHPELALVARRWAVGTYRKICGWADGNGLPVSDDRQYLDALFHDSAGYSTWARPRRLLRVLTYRWHVPHQYELYKLPFDFTLLTGLGSPMTESWEFGQRPMPPNARFSRFDQVEAGHYDLAILHFDENVLSPENTNGVLGQDWGLAFKWLREHLDIPKVAICHGTPQFYGQYNPVYDGTDLMQVIEPERLKLVEYLADIPVVLNSHQAQREWGFANSRVIWHGFDPAEFPPATYEKGILAPLGPLVRSRPHYRGYFLYRQVIEGYEAELKPETLRVPDPQVLYQDNAFAFGKYRNYVDEIRRYSVYFNPTLRSPMPRARGEPMMCGVVTVSASNHDVDMFIRNGENGFFANDPDELREYLFYLLRNPGQCQKIGAAGRATAANVFNNDRFLADWHRLVGEIVASRGPGIR